MSAAVQVEDTAVLVVQEDMSAAVQVEDMVV